MSDTPTEPPPSERTGNRFAPGKSGNPGGRPRWGRLSREIRELLDADGGRRAKALAAKLVALAESGDLQAARLVLERSEGRLRGAIEAVKGRPAPILEEPPRDGRPAVPPADGAEPLGSAS